MHLPTNLLAAGLYVVIMAVTMVARGGRPPLPRKPRTILALAIGLVVVGPLFIFNVSPSAAVWPALPFAAILGALMGWLVSEAARHDEKE